MNLGSFRKKGALMKRLRILLVIAALPGLFLAACGGEEAVTEASVRPDHFETYTYLPTRMDLPDTDNWDQGGLCPW